MLQSMESQTVGQNWVTEQQHIHRLDNQMYRKFKRNYEVLFIINKQVEPRSQIRN